MCLAIPGKILSIDSSGSDLMRSAEVSFGGIKKYINISMVPNATVNDYVLVHVGVALSIVNEEEAKRTLSYLDELE